MEFFLFFKQEQLGQDTPEYGVRLLERPSEDLQHKLGKGLSVRNLRKMRRFNLNNRNRPAPADLTWTQHVELLSITNKAYKRRLERRIISDRLSPRQIRLEVRQLKESRYLADVFYLPESTNPKIIYAQGTYLNQQLLDKGLARKCKP